MVKGFIIRFQSGSVRTDRRERLKIEKKRVFTAKEASIFLRMTVYALQNGEPQELGVPYRTPGGPPRHDLEMMNNYLENARILPFLS